MEWWSQSQKGDNDTWAKSRGICRNSPVVGNSEGPGNNSISHDISTLTHKVNMGEGPGDEAMSLE